MSRLNGVDKARAAIGEFKRIQPRDDKTHLEQLAWLALDVASAGIAGGIAKRLEPVLKTVLGRVVVAIYPLVEGVLTPRGIIEIPAGPSLVAMFTDGIKDLVKTGSRKGARAAVEGEEDHEKPSMSVDAREDFLIAHRELIVQDTMQQASDVTIRAHDALLPLLQTKPDSAVSAMEMIAKALGAQQQAAAEDQEHQTVRYPAGIRISRSIPMPKLSSTCANRNVIGAPKV